MNAVKPIQCVDFRLILAVRHHLGSNLNSPSLGVFLFSHNLKKRISIVGESGSLANNFKKCYFKEELFLFGVKD
jgi:hypothetical protein